MTSPPGSVDEGDGHVFVSVDPGGIWRGCWLTHTRRTDFEGDEQAVRAWCLSRPAQRFFVPDEGRDAYLEVDRAGEPVASEQRLSYRHPLAQALQSWPDAGTGTVFLRYEGDMSLAVWQSGLDHVQVEGSESAVTAWALAQDAECLRVYDADVDDFVPLDA